MSKKVSALIIAIVGGLQTIAIGLVTFNEPSNATTINVAIGIAATAVVEICNLFAKPEPEAK